MADRLNPSSHVQSHRWLLSDVCRCTLFRPFHLNSNISGNADYAWYKRRNVYLFSSDFLGNDLSVAAQSPMVHWWENNQTFHSNVVAPDLKNNNRKNGKSKQFQTIPCQPNRSMFVCHLISTYINKPYQLQIKWISRESSKLNVISHFLRRIVSTFIM